jgi:hypothetical protein
VVADAKAWVVSDPSSDQRYVKALPFSGSAWHLRRSSQETADATHAVTGWFLDGVRFDMDFISAAQIDATIRVGRAVEFDMQFEIFEFGIIDQFRTIPRTYQMTVFDLPNRPTWIVQ